jgi:hypothetical protein
VVRLSGASAGGVDESRQSSSPARRAARSLGEAVLLDKHEPRSSRRLRRWHPDVDAAVLVCAPFSPVVYAARRLIEAGIPYVVDAGDPWALTSPEKRRRYLGGWRATRGERLLWHGARGAVVTTPGQARRLSALFPELAVLTRPNGYDPAFPAAASQATEGEQDLRCLRLVHFGSMYEPRVDLARFLGMLRRAGPWEEVSLTQYGSDWTGALRRLPPGVTADARRPVPWDEAVRAAADFHLAVVVGNRDPAQLPSKAVQYLTLPIPRLAVTGGASEDALAGYVSDKPGWLVASVGDSRAAERVAAHVARSWIPTDLRPPPEESWPAVTARLVQFIDGCLGEQGGDRFAAASTIGGSRSFERSEQRGERPEHGSVRPANEGGPVRP